MGPRKHGGRWCAGSCGRCLEALASPALCWGHWAMVRLPLRPEPRGATAWTQASLGGPWSNHGRHLGRGNSVLFQGAAGCEGQDWTPRPAAARSEEASNARRSRGRRRPANRRPAALRCRRRTEKVGPLWRRPGSNIRRRSGCPVLQSPRRSAVACRCLHVFCCLPDPLAPPSSRRPRSAAHCNPPINCGRGHD